MNLTPPAQHDRPALRDYHGYPTYRLDNDHVWLEALDTAGPRIVRFGLFGSSANLLAETPDLGWETTLGRYELLGGHRLWFAPENPDIVAVPDSEGLVLTETETGIRLDGPPEPQTRVVRSISVALVPGAPAVELCHRLTNAGERSIELAPWSITQLPLGGVVRLPQPPAVAEHRLHPNRLLVLWPYTTWEDPRLELCEGQVRVRAEAGPRMKVGSFVEGGVVSYARDGVTLTCAFRPEPGVRRTDMGCNVEVYIGDGFVELEVLGPLVELAPGQEVTLDERWDVAPWRRLSRPGSP